MTEPEIIGRILLVVMWLIGITGNWMALAARRKDKQGGL